MMYQAFQFASFELRNNNEDITLAVFKRYAYFIKQLPEKYRNDKDIVALAAIRQNEYRL